MRTWIMFLVKSFIIFDLDLPVSNCSFVGYTLKYKDLSIAETSGASVSDPKDILRWLYWYPFRFIIQALPIRVVYLIGNIEGTILYHFSKKRYKSLKSALSSVIKKEDLATKNERGIIRDALKLFCQNELEMFLYAKLNTSLIKNMVVCEGLSYINESLKQGKGVMLLFAHFGANQMIMPAIGYRGYKMYQMSAPPTVWTEKMHNKKFSYMGKRALDIRWEQELSLPVTHINIFGSLKEAFVCLKRNEILGIAIDGGGGKSRVAVNFLGGKALFSTGAIEIAMRTGCVVLPIFMIKGRDGRHIMIIEPPLEIIKERQEGAVEKNITAFVKKLEEYVLTYPSHYLNFLALRKFMEDVDGIPFIIKNGEG